MRKPGISKDEVISAIKAAARRLKRTPTRSEFHSISGIHWMKVQRLFGGYRAAVREAGLEPDPGGIRIDTAAMLLDFGRVARRVKRHPTRDEYEELGKYASASLENRFRRWSAMREIFLEYVAGNGLEREWGDVAESLRNGPVPRRGGGRNWLKPKTSLPRIAADERGSEANPKPLQHRGTEEAEENWAGDGGASEQSGCAISSEERSHSLLWIAADERGSGANPTPLKHRGTEEAEENWAGDAASEHGETAANSDTHSGSTKSEVLPQTSADERGSKAEPIRAEILYPQLKGMHCVTKTMLWVMMSMQQTSETHNDQSGNEEMQRDENGHDCPDRALSNGGWQQAGHPAALSQVIGKPGALEGPISSQLNVASLNLRFSRRVFPGRPLMGPPFLPQPRNVGASGELALMLHGMAYEPVNEMGVVFLFGMVAPLLGFRVEALQTGFPDCKAKLEVEPGRWQDVNVEFEFESRKFRDHHHDPLKCDIIVCWRHNWKGCPEWIQVLELSRILGVSR